MNVRYCSTKLPLHKANILGNERERESEKKRVKKRETERRRQLYAVT